MTPSAMARWVGCFALLSLGGCALSGLPAAPASHSEKRPPPRERHEPPQVVEKETEDPNAPSEEDSVERTVLSYIDQVDAVGQRTRQRQAWQVDPDPSIQHAADTEPLPSSQPVVQRPVVIEPEQPTPAPAQVPPSEDPNASAAPTRDEDAKLAALTADPDTPPTAPPALVGVAVHAAPEFTADVTAPESPSVNTATIAQNAPHSLRAFLDQRVPPEDAGFREQLDLRTLYVVAGEYDRAREPLNMVTREQQELAAGFIDALIAIREGHMGDLSGAANSAATELSELLTALRQLSDLSVPVVKICSAVRGFGQYDEVSPARFLAGGPREFVLYCEVRDFVSERRDDGLYYTTFDMTTTILNRIGDTVLEIKDTDIVDRCRNQRQDCFIPRLVRLPATLAPGHYVAKVTIVDKLGQKVAESRAPLELVARP